MKISRLDFKNSGTILHGERRKRFKSKEGGRIISAREGGGVQPLVSEPEPDAVGLVALIQGVTKGSGSSETRAPVLTIYRGNIVYVVLSLLIAGFGFRDAAPKFRR